MARLKTGNFDFLAFRNSYHGMSNLTMGVSGLNTWKQRRSPAALASTTPNS